MRVVVVVVALLAALAGPAAAGVRVHPSDTLVFESFTIEAGYHHTYQLNVSAGTQIVAAFAVAGDVRNNVDVWLLDAANHQRRVEGGAFSFFESASGEITDEASFAITVREAGVYFLVIENGAGNRASRQVDLYVYAVQPGATRSTQELEEAFGGLYETLQAIFVFPDFDVRIRHCGVVDGFPDPDITLCRESVDLARTREKPAAVEFLALHGLAHTLLELWGLPRSDNEDAADELATVLLVIDDVDEAAREAAEWWAAQGSAHEALARLGIRDRHVPSLRRARNVLRWVEGRDELLSRWQRLLVPQIRTDLLRELEADPARESWIDRDLVREVLAGRP